MVNKQYRSTNKTLIYKVCLIALAVIITITSAPTTYAVSPFIKENTYVYNPDSNCNTVLGASSASMSIVGDTNAEKIFNYLTGKGLSKEAAAGVLGNIDVESAGTLSPFIQEFSQKWPRGGYGLVQWTAGRRRAIEAALKRDLPDYFQYYDQKYTALDKQTGLPKALPEDEAQRVNDAFLQFQLDYLYQESTTRKIRQGYGTPGDTEWESLLNSSTVREASDIWLYSFERPRDQSTSHAASRAARGQTWLDKLGDSTNTTLAASSASTQSLSNTDCVDERIGSFEGSGSVQDLQQLTMLYASPKNHPPGYITKTSAYETATQKAKSNGHYTGACDGVDCGAFTTRLVIDSGWDPEFNYSGDISKGALNTPVQKRWLEQNWEVVGTGKTDTSLLKPGDVAIKPGHTFIFVGNIPGFEKQIASASQCERAPMAGGEMGMSEKKFSSYKWYRKKG